MKIEFYQFGRIVIAGEEYRDDVIIFPDCVKSWWRKEGHKLHLEDLPEILEKPPQILVIGKGYSGLMEVPSEVEKELKSRGIELKIVDTREATQIYNKLIEERKDVVAALHLTC